VGRVGVGQGLGDAGDGMQDAAGGDVAAADEWDMMSTCWASVNRSRWLTSCTACCGSASSRPACAEIARTTWPT
jgi:hypothetical protein